MSVNEKDRYIQYLVEWVNEAELDNRALRLVLDDFVKEKGNEKAMLSDLQAEQKRIKEESEGLEAQRKKRIAAEREIAILKAQLKFAQTNQSGDKSQKVRKADSKDATSDRNYEKDNFDGTSESLSSVSVPRTQADAALQAADKYIDNLGVFSNQEQNYDVEGLPPKERGKRRQSLETKSKLIELRTYLTVDLAKPESERTGYLTETFNYLNHF